MVFVVHIHQKSLVGRTKLITTENFVENNSTRKFDLTHAGQGNCKVVQQKRTEFHWPSPNTKNNL